MESNVKTLSIDTADLSIFSQMSESEVNEVLLNSNSLVRTFRKSDYVSFPGDSAKELGVVLEGTIHAVAESVLGKKTIISNLTRGDLVYGNIFYREQNRQDVNYLVAKDSKILLLPIEGMHRANLDLDIRRKMLFNIMRLVAANETRLVEKIDIMGQRFVRDRVLMFLRMESKRQGCLKFTIPYNRTDLADYLSVDRSSLTRELYQMKKEGLIDFNRNVFEVKFEL